MGWAVHSSHGMRPVANNHSVTTSQAVQIGRPLASVQNTFSLSWLPKVNRSLCAAGHLALYLNRVSWARRTYRRRWNTPYQAINTTALRTSRRAIHPKPNDDIVARDGVATNHAAIATSAYNRLKGN